MLIVKSSVPIPSIDAPGHASVNEGLATKHLERALGNAEKVLADPKKDTQTPPGNSETKKSS